MNGKISKEQNQLTESRNNFIVNVAESSDKNWIAETQIKMAAETENIQLDRDIVNKGVQFMFDHPDRGFYVIAKDTFHRPAGILLVLKEWSDWRNGDVWWIHSVYVEKEFRRQRVFSHMFRFVEEIAQAESVRGLRLYVEKENKRAKAAYERLGMSSDRYDMYEKMFGEY
ncbi:MAG: GNAT family N-acetyltransferase [Calditrichaeota bacterium]|nr:GNAT family N-acetyltransferase [Calditrichota bacterium]